MHTVNSIVSILIIIFVVVFLIMTFMPSHGKPPVIYDYSEPVQGNKVN